MRLELTVTAFFCAVPTSSALPLSPVPVPLLASVIVPLESLRVNAVGVPLNVMDAMEKDPPASTAAGVAYAPLPLNKTLTVLPVMGVLLQLALTCQSASLEEPFQVTVACAVETIAMEAAAERAAKAARDIRFELMVVVCDSQRTPAAAWAGDERPKSRSTAFVQVKRYGFSGAT